MSRPLIWSLLLSGLMAGSAWAQSATATLTWTAGAFAAEHRVERKIDSGAYEQVAIVLMPQLTYVDAKLALGRTYCYRVVAANESGVAAPSEERCGIPLSLPASATGLSLSFTIAP